MPRFLGVLLVPLTLACSKAPSPRAADPPRLAGQSMGDSLSAAIGEPLCKGHADCWLVPVGKKPCGGPRTYAVASKGSSDSLTVRAWSDRLSAEEAARNVREGRMSDCSMVVPPDARCVSGRCVTQTSSGR